MDKDSILTVTNYITDANELISELLGYVPNKDLKDSPRVEEFYERALYGRLSEYAKSQAELSCTIHMAIKNNLDDKKTPSHSNDV